MIARTFHLLAAGCLAVAMQVFGQGLPPATAAAPPNANTAYQPTLTFDVASVRQSPLADSYRVGGSFAPHSSSLRVTNFSIENLLHMAYGYDRFYRISGVPDSFNWVMFNVQAKSDSATDEKLASLNQKQAALEQQHMLQVLLAERFHLKTHWETRDSDVYNLVVKNSSKLQKATGKPPDAEELKRFGDHPVPPLYQRGDSRSGFDFIAHGCSIEMIVDMLVMQFGRLIVDKTGLNGKYDFVLRYYGTNTRDVDAASTNPLPPLDTAIQDQLGLKLEPAKGPIPFLVIDHIEKPSEN